MAPPLPIPPRLQPAAGPELPHRRPSNTAVAAGQETPLRWGLQLQQRHRPADPPPPPPPSQSSAGLGSPRMSPSTCTRQGGKGKREGGSGCVCVSCVCVCERGKESSWTARTSGEMRKSGAGSITQRLVSGLQTLVLLHCMLIE